LRSVENAVGLGAAWPAPPPVSDSIWKIDCSATSPYDNVIKAKYRPVMRSDTPPNTRAWRPPTAMATTTATKNDCPCTETM
jgi:hypothetical protein